MKKGKLLSFLLAAALSTSVFYSPACIFVQAAEADVEVDTDLESDDSFLQDQNPDDNAGDEKVTAFLEEDGQDQSVNTEEEVQEAGVGDQAPDSSEEAVIQGDGFIEESAGSQQNSEAQDPGDEPVLSDGQDGTDQLPQDQDISGQDPLAEEPSMQDAQTDNTDNIVNSGNAEDTRSTDGGPNDRDESPVLDFEPGEELLTVYPAMEAAVNGENAQVCSSVSDVLNYVREQTFSRAGTITVKVPEAVMDQLDLSGYEDITAHTGDPRGGDYLRNTMKSMGAGYSTSGDGNYTLQYNFTYYDTAADEQAAAKETARLVSSLGLKNSAKSDYDKIKAIHDFITANVEYDYDTFNGRRSDYPQTYSGSGAIVNHLAVCQGFSCMFYRLCLEAGIDVRIISSHFLAHAWNIVKLGSVYYLMDCTWDQNTSTDSFFLRGKNDFNDHSNSDDQFQDEAFSKKYPLSKYKYGFTIKSLGSAPDFTLITQDRRTVSTAAQNGRSKVLIFVMEGCLNCQATLDSLRGKEFKGVDFVYVYMRSLSSDQQKALSLIGSEFITDVPGVYAVCANGSDALSVFENTAGIADPNGYSYSPTYFLINPANQIIYADQGYNSSLVTMIEDLLADPSLPSAPAIGEAPYAGFTAIGNCGQNAVWRFYKDGTLRISGSGKLFDEGNYYISTGWLPDGTGADHSFSCENISASAIKKVIIDKGITYVGNMLFADCNNLESITFKGNAPQFSSRQGVEKDIRIYYPENDTSWNRVNKTLFSSGSRWISQNADGIHSHKWGACRITKAATTKAEGIKECICSECGAKMTEKIAKLSPAEQKISVKASASSAAVGKTVTLSVTGANGATSFISSNKSVATVDKNGKVKAVKVGTVKITVNAAETDIYKAASKTVTIKIVPAATSSITSVNQAKSIKYTWKKVSGASGYKLYRGSKLIATVKGGSKTTYTDKTAKKNGTKYSIKVKAYASTGDSTLSKTLTTYFVSQPAVKNITNKKKLTAAVEWNQNKAATGYQIQYGLKKSFSGAKTATVNKKTTVSTTLSMLKKGKVYYVRIRTYKTVGKQKYFSAWSAAKTVTIKK